MRKIVIAVGPLVLPTTSTVQAQKRLTPEPDKTER